MTDRETKPVQDSVTSSQMTERQSFDSSPVPPEQLQSARYFAGNFAGEHVAGTEFVIGALFVAAGAAAQDVIIGLLIGNLLAVLTWALITAPIAVDTRLTLYAYLNKVAGRDFTKMYSVVNGVMFLGLAGSMITVSASAVRVFYNSLANHEAIPPQVGYLPSDWRFVLVALLVGSVVVALAALGFKRLAQFAGAVVPWMICMFLAGALALYPQLATAAGLELPALSLMDLWTVLDSQVYVAKPIDGSFWEIQNEAQSIWSIAAFAWVANLAMHGSLGDMTLLRFARSVRYGWFSVLGMFIGHFLCWICAGVMGAGAAFVLTTSIGALDPGAVATQALGFSGIIAVIIAGWTTSNPTLYRAGLAFQSINPNWGRVRVTIIVGIATMILACSPFIFTELLGYVGWMGLILSPVGAILVAEHWLYPRFGLTRYWSYYKRQSLNVAALIAWGSSLFVVAALYFGGGVHQFFLLLPAWGVSTLSYLLVGRLLGAGQNFPEAKNEAEEVARRRANEQKYLESEFEKTASRHDLTQIGLHLISFIALVWALLLAGQLVVANAQSYPVKLEFFRSALVWPTVVFFVASLAAAFLPHDDN